MMRRTSTIAMLLLALTATALAAAPAFSQQRWSEAKANAWYAQQPYLVGSNFVPDDAINELEMWQAATFDPKEIDRELGWAQGLGMNTMRVFLQDQLWQQDPGGFKQRIDEFLTIAGRHHIRPIFVLFDSCWDPYPKLGPQHPPIPGVHNSGWVQSPGKIALMDSAQYPRLKTYVQGVVGAFANDPRILAWDVWNEPDNTNGGSYGKEEPPNKVDLVLHLLPQVFEWARAEHPAQPLTSGVWQGDWSTLQTLSPMARVQITESDIITFHNYGWPEDFQQRIKELKQYHRPIICTEYMARGVGSLFDTILPLAKQNDVGAINWGFVAGKTQTFLPWDSWQRPYVLEQPPVWFHDIFYPDGRPYREREAEIIRKATGVSK
ncbi:MAG TPA: cellulase family glycosylhydrolase [Acidobacteriaceae bacterium]|nr:cellulase family glycosylhydrolase [Acidobacteriaceae bacterium]